MAEHHIDTCHSYDTLDDFKCDMCELKDDFLAIPRHERSRISNRSLPKWIGSKLRIKNLEREMRLQSLQEEGEEDEQEEEGVDFSDKKKYAAEFPSLPSEGAEPRKYDREEEESSYAYVVKK